MVGINTWTTNKIFCQIPEGLSRPSGNTSNLLVSSAKRITSVSENGPAAQSVSGVVKILDLGLARLQPTLKADATTHTVTAVGTGMMGTLDFMSPDQALDFRKADIRSDIYSLGCTFYFC